MAWWQEEIETKLTKNMKIEKNIPIPPLNYSGNRVSIFKQMKKGDSIFIKSDKENSRQSWWTTANRLNIKIVTRKEGKGFRLWHGGKKKGGK